MGKIDVERLESYNKICRTRLLDLYQKIKRYI